MANNHFIVGAQRSGTTYLLDNLNQHPEICITSKIKPEPKFFLKKNELINGRQFYLNKYFKNHINEKILIEKSTSYIQCNEAALAINKMFPNARIIILLRNPVNRALSNFFFSKINGLENRKIEEVFLEEKSPPVFNTEISVNPFDYLNRGKYINYIDNYVSIFGKEKLGIYLFENLINDSNTLQEIYNFLGVNSNFKPVKMTRKVNSTYNTEHISKNIIEKLKTYYNNYNIALEKKMKLDLSIWNK